MGKITFKRSKPIDIGNVTAFFFRKKDALACKKACNIEDGISEWTVKEGYKIEGVKFWFVVSSGKGR
ncbi:unnamed protein product [marine sediment metagenome]|uniref:Uncharacterized protein n=1 Tax=marine sediment metagenome TaxID=412755 RepID=X1H282_9ZZZZ